MNKQEQMNMLKQEYTQIEVPSAALIAVQNGIKKAKQERYAQRKRWRQLAVAAVITTIIVLPNFNPQIAMAVSDIPILHKIVQLVTLNHYQEKTENGNYEANVQTPALTAQGSAQLQSSVGAINADVQAHADQMIAQFQQEKTQQDGVYGLDVKYNVVTDTEKWFTLQITTLETAASGAQTIQYYNLDKTTDKYVQLSDLFAADTDYITAISDNIKLQMKTRMAKDANQIYFIDTDMPSDDFHAIAADQSFYLNQAGQLVITFNEYEVAPGSMGCPQFIIDDAVIKALQQ